MHCGAPQLGAAVLVVDRDKLAELPDCSSCYSELEQRWSELPKPAMIKRLKDCRLQQVHSAAGHAVGCGEFQR